jgi:HTH-type transcriptional regulator/antitoxin HipB
MSLKNNDLEIKAQTKEQLIKAVQRFRKANSMTQKELSEKSGVPQSSVSKFEANSREPSLSLLFKIISALNLEVTVRRKKSVKSKSDSVVI